MKTHFSKSPIYSVTSSFTSTLLIFLDTRKANTKKHRQITAIGTKTVAAVNTDGILVIPIDLKSIFMSLEEKRIESTVPKTEPIKAAIVKRTAN